MKWVTERPGIITLSSPTKLSNLCIAYIHKETILSPNAKKVDQQLLNQKLEELKKELDRIEKILDDIVSNPGEDSEDKITYYRRVVEMLLDKTIDIINEI